MVNLPGFLRRLLLLPESFRRDVTLAYDMMIDEVRLSMEDVYKFMHVVNNTLVKNGLDRLEDTILGNSLSGIISELLVLGLSRYSKVLVRNCKVGGHPDLIPVGMYEENAVLQGREGVEVKASIQPGGWQGHNPERCWVMVFHYAVDEATEPKENRRPLEFLRVMMAELTEGDWSFSGRRGQSRRTPTASILRSGMEKLRRNVIYEDAEYLSKMRRTP